MCTYSFEDWPGILSGCILGDGYVLINRIITSHTTPQRDYVSFKHQWFSGLGLSSRTRMDYWRNTSFGRFQYSEVSVIMPNKYLIPQSPVDLVGELNPFGLLIWWLDDGSLTVSHKKNGTSVSRFGYLNTQAYDKDTNEQLSTSLQQRFGIETRVHKDVGSGIVPNAIYYRLYLNATNMRKLIDIVRDMIDYIPKSMLYKLNMQYTPNRTRNSSDFAKLYNF